MQEYSGSKKKIVIVSRCAWNLYKFRLDLAIDLRNRGYEVMLAAEPNGFEEKLIEKGFSFYPVRGAENGFGLLFLFWDLLRLYRRLKPDLIHHYTVRPLFFGSLAAYFYPKAKLCNTLTGLGHTFLQTKGFTRFVIMSLYRVALSRSKKVFFQNSEDMSLFVEKGIVSAKKTVLVPGSGVSLSRYLLDSSDSTKPFTNFIMISRLIKEKGILDYLSACKILKESKGMHFYLLGSTDEKNPSTLTVESARALVNEANVKWISYQDDIRPLLKKMDVVVLPSYREGIPRSLLEAAAMGKALISTDVEGSREVVDNNQNGLLVPVRNPKALAEAMVYLASDPELRRSMGMASRQIAEKRFDQKIVFDLTHQSYSDLFESAATSY